MSKAVMIPIQPKWCELIASGEKTIEVRKTRPQLQTPFKCYIYCTSKKIKAEPMNTNGIIRVKIKPPKHASIKRIANSYPWFQKVIGEFVCDVINEHNTSWLNGEDYSEKYTCLSDEEIMEYMNCTLDKKFYLWYISDLKIYDKPKGLEEFYVWKKCNACIRSGYESTACRYDEDCKVPAMITRPPQSWQYVEEV